MCCNKRTVYCRKFIRTLTLTSVYLFKIWMKRGMCWFYINGDLFFGKQLLEKENLRHIYEWCCKFLDHKSDSHKTLLFEFFTTFWRKTENKQNKYSSFLKQNKKMNTCNNYYVCFVQLSNLIAFSECSIIQNTLLCDYNLE